MCSVSELFLNGTSAQKGYFGPHIFLFVDDDDETATNSESVVSKSQLSELCSEAAKLKSMGVMNQVCRLIFVYMKFAVGLKVYSEYPVTFYIFQMSSLNCHSIVFFSYLLNLW